MVGVAPTWRERATLKVLAELYPTCRTICATLSLSDSVALELEPFNIRLRVVRPGRAPTTRFGDNARAAMTGSFPEPYLPLVEQVMAGWQQDTGPTTSSEDVADAVWRAVIDTSAPAHLPAGADAVVWSQARKKTGRARRFVGPLHRPMRASLDRCPFRLNFKASLEARDGRCSVEWGVDRAQRGYRCCGRNHYFPAHAVDAAALQPSSTTTVRSWTGTARDHSLSIGDAVNPDAAWYYLNPKPEAEQIRGRIAFWKRVEVG